MIGQLIVLSFVCFSGMANQNPWQANSIQDFWFLKCPECSFETKDEKTFQAHAVENHPASLDFFIKIVKEETPDENFAGNNYEDMIKSENIFVDSLKCKIWCNIHVYVFPVTTLHLRLNPICFHFRRVARYCLGSSHDMVAEFGPFEIFLIL